MSSLNRLDPSRPRSVVAWALLAGAVAGLLAATFHLIVTEPLIDDAIAIEETRAAAEGDLEHAAAEPEQVSRADQRGPGLFLGYALLGAAYGLLVAVAALALRGEWLDPLRRVVLAGSILATSLTVLPWLKYPPNPPAVGDPGTSGERQRLFWLLVVLVGVTLAGVAYLSHRLRDQGWPEARRIVAVIATAVVVIGVAVALLPQSHDAIPADVPVTLMWRFRVASLTGNLLMWSVLTLGLALVWSNAAAGAPATATARSREAAQDQNSMPLRAEIPES